MKPWGALACGVALAILFGCAVRPEHSVLDEFFLASRLRDLTRLSRISLVVLEPREAGAVGKFNIQSVSSVRRSPLQAGDQVVRLSLLARAPALSNAAGLTGEIETEEVTLLGPLRRPSGPTSDATLIATLSRAIVRGDRRITGRWIVTAVRGAAEARPLPPP
jgi:hypothetical protein